jgi:hypothetical protein
MDISKHIEVKEAELKEAQTKYAQTQQMLKSIEILIHQKSGALEALKGLQQEDKPKETKDGKHTRNK